ncbi:MAG: hypothetical protein VYC82_07265, partial [Verrucomicrobiota bacterium]|nr:hypothetical protein [Verrucomicrobiota bacterium]
MKISITLSTILFVSAILAKAESLEISTQSDWERTIASSMGIVIKDGLASPTGKSGNLKTKIQKFDTKRSVGSLTITQSPIWQNWNPIENLGPSNLQDAPVLLTLGPDDYWIFGRYGTGQPRPRRGEQPKPLPPFDPEPATLEGFDIPLQNTRFPKQFDAPGGLKPGKRGYHAWQSRDMKNWVHHGPVTEEF